MQRARRGVTLLEQVMALTILSVGLLAVASAGNLLHRGARHALRAAQAVAVAAAWRERLTAAGCAGAAGGTAADAGLQVRWTAEELGAVRVYTVRTAELAPGAAPDTRVATHETVGAVRCGGG